MRFLIALCALLPLLCVPATAQQEHHSEHHVVVHHAVVHHVVVRHVAARRVIHRPPVDRTPVVWVNIPSGVYHYQGERWFGRTASGEYMHEDVAIRDGYRATENGQ